MNIIGIDPGPEHSGIVIFDGKAIHYHAVLPNADLLATVQAHAAAGAPKLFAIEMIASYGMPAGRELFETCVWVGRVIQVIASAAAYWKMIYRLEVKKNLCRDTRAKDANIRQALIDRFGRPGTKKAPGITHGLAGDEWSALAIAVTAWDLASLELPLGPLPALPPRPAAPAARV